MAQPVVLIVFYVIIAVFVVIIIVQIVHLICYTLWHWIKIKKIKRTTRRKSVFRLFEQNINWTSTESFQFIPQVHETHNMFLV